MCDLFKNKAELIEYYFGDKEKYDNWRKDLLKKLNDAGITFCNEASFVPVALFPEKKEEKTEGGIYKPEISEYSEHTKLRVGKRIYALEPGLTIEDTCVVRPYGNIDLGSDVYLVSSQNLLFNIRK